MAYCEIYGLFFDQKVDVKRCDKKWKIFCSLFCMRGYGCYFQSLKTNRESQLVARKPEDSSQQAPSTKANEQLISLEHWPLKEKRYGIVIDNINRRKP